MNTPRLIGVLITLALLGSPVNAATVTFAALDPVFLSNANAVPLGTISQQTLFYGPAGVTGVEGASEVTDVPVANQSVGATLSFLSGPVDFILTTNDVPGATFVWNDTEPVVAINPLFAESLSIGDIDNEEDDDFKILFLDDNVYGVNFQVIDNGRFTNELLTVELVNGETFTIDTFSSIVSSTGPSQIDDYGIMSIGSGIRSIVFDEDSFGDDIGLRYIQAATISAVPIPPALWLFGYGLLGLIVIARRKKAA